MLKTIFNNESFLIESIKTQTNKTQINLGYIITPKFLNIPVFNFYYLKKIENIMQHIGATQIKEKDMHFDNAPNNSLRYFLTNLKWKSITNIINENSFYAEKDVEFELDEQETRDQERLFTLLSDLNDDIDYGKYADM